MLLADVKRQHADHDGVGGTLGQNPGAKYRIDQKGKIFRTRRKACRPVGATDAAALSASQKNKSLGKSSAVNNYYNSNLASFKYLSNNLSYISHSTPQEDRIST
jgi:hypothetical protein